MDTYGILYNQIAKVEKNIKLLNESLHIIKQSLNLINEEKFYKEFGKGV